MPHRSQVRICILRSAFALVCLCITISFSSLVKGQSLGRLAEDMPRKVKTNVPFEFDVWLVPKDNHFNGTVNVTTSKIQKVRYEPSEFTLNVGKPQRVKATILDSDSGLAIISVYADNWDPIDITIDAGFFAKLKTDLTAPVESGRIKNFQLLFTDAAGNVVKFDAPPKLFLEASKLSLHSKDPDLWTNDLEMVLPNNSAKIPLELKPDKTWSVDTGTIDVQLKTYQGDSVFRDTIYVSIVPPWYVQLIMAIVGGLLYSMYQFFKYLVHLRKKRVQPILTRAAASVLTGSMAGVTAYFLANYNVLGIKVDTTDVQGFVILGFLFSYVGVDLILKAITSKKMQS